MVVFRCNLDIATGYTNSWGEEVVNALRNAGLTVHDYSGTEANPPNFRLAIIQHNPLAVFIFDHGSECDIWGDGGGYFASMLGLYNAELTEGRVVVVLACSSAAKLGVVCVDKYGCRAYCGYDEKFGFLSSDPYLDGFRRAAIEPFLRLAMGSTLQQALLATRAVCNNILTSWMSDAFGKDAPVARAAMMSNRDHLVLLGDGSSTIIP